MAGAGRLRRESDRRSPTPWKSRWAKARTAGEIAFAVGIVLALVGLYLGTVSPAVAGFVALAGLALAGLGVLVAVAGLILSSNLATWIRRWPLHRRLRRLPYNAHLVLMSALDNPGGRIILPTDLAEAWALVDMGCLEVTLSRPGATAFQIPRALVKELYPWLFVGDAPTDGSDPKVWIGQLEKAARAHLATGLPLPRLCAGPVADTGKRDTWHKAGLPWMLSPSYAILEQGTRGGAIIMDYRTWDALPERPLADRQNIVVTRGEQTADLIDMEGGEIAETLEDALLLARQYLVGSTDGMIHVIGGPALFRRTLKWCDEIHLTEIAAHAGSPSGFAPPTWQETLHEITAGNRSDEPILHRVLTRSSQL